jgi:hydrogenase expression/formation protein HypC
MCVGLPAVVIGLSDDRTSATVEAGGVRRAAPVFMLDEGPLEPGDWVLVHCGLVVGRMTDAEAGEVLELLASAQRGER